MYVLMGAVRGQQVYELSSPIGRHYGVEGPGERQQS
jgi:hypothetical protein